MTAPAKGPLGERCTHPGCGARPGEMCSEIVTWISTGKMITPFRDVMMLPHAARVRAVQRGQEEGR